MPLKILLNDNSQTHPNDIIKCDSKLEICFGRAKGIFGKGENGSYHNLLLFQRFFYPVKDKCYISSYTFITLTSANGLNLDKADYVIR